MDNKIITPSELDAQEHLSKTILQSFEPSCVANIRPYNSLKDIIEWIEYKFTQDLSAVTTYVNSDIIIDGQFYQFCKESNITIDCLYKESAVTTTSAENFEKFFFQGIFKITYENSSFLQSSLFFKGIHNEDEVTFLITCALNDYEKFLELKTKYKEWARLRDRGNQVIKVIDGIDMPYERNNSWDDLFLTSSLKEDVKNIVETFLLNKDFYLQNKIPWKRGIILYGPQGNGKSSIIKTIISNYNFKPITILPEANNESVREAFAYAQEQSPALLYIEDLDSLLQTNLNLPSFLNLMDGVVSKNGLFVIATANNIDVIPKNITDRPSRFDRKFNIPVPDLEMSVLYLKKWFGTTVKPQKIKQIAAKAVKLKLTYAYLKELYISSMFKALSSNRKTLIEKDIDDAFDVIIKERAYFGSSVNTDRYFKES